MSIEEGAVAQIEQGVSWLQGQLMLHNEERNIILAGLTRIAIKCGFNAGIVLIGSESEKTVEHFLIYIDFPSGQASWHVHVDFKPYFEDIPFYEGRYDGHSNEDKRIRTIYPLSDVAKQGDEL